MLISINLAYLYTHVFRGVFDFIFDLDPTAMNEMQIIPGLDSL